MSARPNRLIKRLLVGAAACAALVPVAGYVLLSSLDTQQLVGYAATFVKDSTGRTLRIEGEPEIGFGFSPTLTLGKVTLSNPDWAKQPHLLAAVSVNVRMELLPLLRREVVISELSASGVALTLEKNTSGVGSWVFTPKEKPSKKSAPSGQEARKKTSGFTTRIGPLVLKDTAIQYDDHARGKPVSLSIPDIRVATDPSFTLEASLALDTLHGDLSLTGAALPDITQKPMTLALSLSGTQDAHLQVKGKIKNLDGTPSLALALDMQADTLSAFAPLTGSTLPETEALKLSAELAGSGQEWTLDNVKATLGSTDASGRGRLSLSGEKPMVSATLAIPVYRVAEGNAVNSSSSAVPSDAPRIAESKRVIPDVAFPSSALSAVNADVEFTIGEIKTKKTTLNSAMGHLVLKEGIMQLDPVQFKLGEDLIKGRLAYNSRAKTPVMDMSFATQGSDLGTFLKTLGTTEKISGGMFHGALALKGQGTSLRAMLPSVSGALELVVENTTLKDPKLQSATELANLMQGKERSGDVHLNCALGKLAIVQGIGTPDYLVADMKNARVYGEGSFNLPQEQLALIFYPQPKSAGFSELSFPVKIKGSFAEPEIKPDRTQAAFSVTKMFVDSKKLRGVEALLGKGKGATTAQKDLSSVHPCLTPITPAPIENTPSLKDAVGIKKEGVKENLKTIEDDVRGLRDGLKGLF